MATDSELKEALRQRVDNDVLYHSPNDEARRRHELIRDNTNQLAHLFIDLCPPGRELSMALTKLIDEAMAHANAAIARNHDRLPVTVTHLYPHEYDPGDVDNLSCCRELPEHEIHTQTGSPLIIQPYPGGVPDGL